MNKPIQMKKLRLKLAQNHTRVKTWTQISLRFYVNMHTLKRKSMNERKYSQVLTALYLYMILEKHGKPQTYLDTL